MREKLDKALVGACGVFFVSAELSRRGWIAMPTIRNTQGIDIIATKAEQSVNIQVKTNSYGKVKYPLDKKNEEMIDDNTYYVFVTLKEFNERPDFYIFRSGYIAEYIKDTHEYWTKMKPRQKKAIYEKASGEEIIQKRKKSTMRQFPNYIGNELPKFKNLNIDDHKDNWKILEP